MQLPQIGLGGSCLWSQIIGELRQEDSRRKVQDQVGEYRGNTMGRQWLSRGLQNLFPVVSKELKQQIKVTTLYIQEGLKMDTGLVRCFIGMLGPPLSPIGPV